MTVKDSIGLFQKRLKAQLEEHDLFFDQWEKTDWHDRCVLIDMLLHGMWSTYEEAEDITEELKDTFPPYPFTEIKEIKRWIKMAIHKLDDFLNEEYTPTDNEDYLSNYEHFLAKICSEDECKNNWQRREKQIAECERQLLDMLNKSYSILLELLLASYKTIQHDDQTIMLAYENSKARYEQLSWTDKKDKGAFCISLKNQFPWGDPTKMQLQEYYQSKFKELKKTRVGKLWTENSPNTFVLELAKYSLSENELRDFFHTQKELEFLFEKIDSMSDVMQENNEPPVSKKRGTPIQYLFINDNPTQENTFVKNQEVYRFMQYMKAHNLASRSLSCRKNDKVNDILTCFLIHWRERGFTADNPSGGAIFRFMKDDCKFKSGVSLESYANEMKERIKNNKYDIKTYQSVLECFKKEMST